MTNRLTEFFMCNENYHLEHHLFPRVPWYNLKQLHGELHQQLLDRDSPVVHSYFEFVCEFVRKSWDRAAPSAGADNVAETAAEMGNTVSGLKSGFCGVAKVSGFPGLRLFALRFLKWGVSGYEATSRDGEMEPPPLAPGNRLMRHELLLCLLGLYTSIVLIIRAGILDTTTIQAVGFTSAYFGFAMAIERSSIRGGRRHDCFPDSFLFSGTSSRWHGLCQQSA